MKTKNLKFVDDEIDNQMSRKPKSRPMGRHKKVSEKDIIQDGLDEFEQEQTDSVVHDLLSQKISF